MARPGWRGICALLLAGSVAGCAGSTDQGAGSSSTPDGSRATKPVFMVGFDASESLVEALRLGKIQGLVVQNPLRMGELSVKTMVKHLEKQPFEAKVSTGETLV